MSLVPKKAVVLAAGFGTRLQPLTFVMPKPLMPVWGRAMLERIIFRLRDWGVEEIAVNAHWQADKIRRFVKDYLSRFDGVKITVSEEKEILGTGGALNPLRSFIGNDPFWLVNGDIVEDGLEAERIIKAYEASGNFAGCWITQDFGPRTIEVDPEGRVCNWNSDFPGDWGTYTYCGCALLSPKILDYVPDTGFSTIVSAYEKAMMNDAKFVVGASVEGSYWNDVGTFERYLETHAAFDLNSFEDNPNVIFHGVKLLESANLSGCVVTGGLIGGEFERAAIVGVAQLENAALKEAVKALCWKEEDAAAEYLGKRGSNREFWRLINGDDRAIVIIYDDVERPENARYASITKMLLKAGISVPRIYADIKEHKILVMEDVGRDSLETLMAKSAPNALKLYKSVVRELAKFHLQGTQAALEKDAPELEMSFDSNLYKWEHELFEKYMAGEYFGFDKLPDDVAAELKSVATELERTRPVLVHRDFQSTNVLVKGEDSFAFIDYQGCRLGSAAYDLASLLYDPYVEIGEKERNLLLKEYVHAAPELGDVVKVFHKAAVQRLVQALGAYGRLASVGKTGFLKYVPRALDNLLLAADEADLDAVGAFAEELIARENMRPKA